MRKGLSTIVIIIAAVAAGISLSMKPWRVYSEQKRTTQVQLAELHRIETDHVSDLQKEAKLSSSVGREQLARGQGWRRKGEVPSGD